MAYIGPEPAESFTSFATQEFSTSATTSYTLDHAVANENEIALFVNNVRQQPGSGKAYTATGTALTLSAATASTDTMYCVFLGRALQTVTPATNSITAAMVGNDLISGKDALTVSPATTDELLISDAGTLKRIDFSLLGNTPAFSVYKNSNFDINDATETKVAFDTETYDTDSAFASNKFTVPSGAGGKYFFYSRVRFQKNGVSEYSIIIKKNNSDVAKRYIYSGAVGTTIFTADYFSFDVSCTLNLSATDYVEVFIYMNSTDGGACTVNGGSTHNEFTGYKLIGV
jgi:hypothetical protein